ncbi:unnamed protein product [Arctogadus glacialis]
MVTPLDSLCSSACWAQQLRGSATMSTLPSLNTLGRICGSSHSDDTLVLDRAKRKNSVRRMSIIEDGEIAEVLYLIPKQSMMEQLPFLNPNDYILCEKMAGMPFELPQDGMSVPSPSGLSISLMQKLSLRASLVQYVVSRFHKRHQSSEVSVSRSRLKLLLNGSGVIVVGNTWISISSSSRASDSSVPINLPRLTARRRLSSDQRAAAFTGPLATMLLSMVIISSSTDPGNVIVKVIGVNHRPTGCHRSVSERRLHSEE